MLYRAVLAFLFVSVICAHPALATPMWSNCNDMTTNFFAPPGGGSFEAVGCLFPPKITNVSLTEMAERSAASVLISDGIVQMGEQSGIWVVCPESSISKLLG
eukprot:PhF_6_TR3141/c0_g1_i1/m.4545